MAKKLSPRDVFHEAVKKAGGQVKFAELCGCTQGNISQLMRKGSVLPAQYVLVIERAGLADRHALRPDLYPREDKAA